MKGLPGRMALIYGGAVCLLAGCTLVNAPALRSGAMLPTRVPVTAGPSPTLLATVVPAETATLEPTLPPTRPPLSPVPPASTPSPLPTMPPVPTNTPLPLPTIPPALTAIPLPTEPPTQAVTPTDTPSPTWTASPTATPMPLPTAIPTLIGPQAIAYGDVMTGIISDVQPERIFTFTGGRGDVITIRLERQSGDLDTILVLLDSAGHELAMNDDAPGPVPSDSRIEQLRLPASGVYTIVATRFQRGAGTTSGEFLLTLRRIEMPIGATPTSAGPQRIAYAQTVVGAINNSSPVVAYTFSGQQGDVVRISLTRLNPADSLDPYLRLMDVAGHELAANDDAPSPADPTTTNAQISGFRLPASGEYIILATRFQETQGMTSGAYALTLLLESRE
ncbi:MAG: hypothetical protein HPY64_10100 [Anaerolineae bacterium]|nr:hypothetical protein [Anaerolineae bacterium]